MSQLNNEDKKFLEKIRVNLRRAQRYIQLTDQQIEDILTLLEEILRDYEVKMY